MTTTTRALTEDERGTISNGLRIAASRFLDNAKSMRLERCQKCLDIPGKDGLGRTCKGCNGTGMVPDNNYSHKRLAEQFAKQYADSLKLAQTIDNAEDITITEAGDEYSGSEVKL